MPSTVFQRLRQTSKLVLWVVAVVLALLLTEAIVVLMQWLQLGRITSDYLITGAVASVLVASSVTGLIIYFLGQFSQMDQDNAHLTSIISACPVPMAVEDGSGKLVMLNSEFIRVLGYTLCDVPTLDRWWSTACPDTAYRQWVTDSWCQRLGSANASGAAFEPLEIKVRCRDGAIKEVLASATRLDMVPGDAHLLLLHDVTERKAVDADLRIAATAFESQEGMVIVAANGIILRVNQAFTRITGFSAQEAVGQTLSLLKSGLQDADFYASMWERIHRDGHWQGEIRNRRKSGEIYTQLLTITAVSSDHRQVTHYVGNMLDISDRKSMESKVHHLAHHDALTDLPNRVLLSDRLNQALAQARREKVLLGLLYLDLDRFKPVNDMLGHDVGDLLLIQVAARLRECVSRTADTVSRIGGDEFVVLLAHLDHEADAVVIADRILEALNQPFTVGSHTIAISTSIGIALYPEHGADALALMKNADNAMYQAKGRGRSCYCLYLPEPAV